MSVFDFNRYRTGDNSIPLATTRDLQKARRSASRSVIRKSKLQFFRHETANELRTSRHEDEVLILTFDSLKSP